MPLPHTQALRQLLESILQKPHLNAEQRYKALTALSELEWRQQQLHELRALRASIESLQDGLANSL